MHAEQASSSSVFGGGGGGGATGLLNKGGGATGFLWNFDRYRLVPYNSSKFSRVKMFNFMINSMAEILLKNIFVIMCSFTKITKTLALKLELYSALFLHALAVVTARFEI